MQPSDIDLPENPAVRADPKRLLIVRLGSMGDIIHTLPAVIALRHAFPKTTFGWVIEERWAELLCTLPTPRSGPRSPQRPLVDRIHTVNTAKWRKSMSSPQTWTEIAAALSELRAPGYEIAADFQGAARSALIARWSGAPVVYGAAQPRENVASMFYTRRMITRGVHVVEQTLSLAEEIAAQPLKLPMAEFPHDPAAEEACDRWLREHNIDDFVIMNPGAGWGAKQWPAERFGSVAKELGRDGLKTLINAGPGENDLAQATRAVGAESTEIISTSLSQLIAFTRRARLFIGGDTGPMHLAAALRVPVVAIFGPTNPARNGPFGTRSITLRSRESITSHRRRAQPDEGLLEISPEQVIAAARELLRSARG
jgi:heptosyltransferase-1